ncbi:MAG: glycosyltransferase [Clostridia bacterium]|nr:glycosyltransferase [Clostridia bacterium]
MDKRESPLVSVILPAYNRAEQVKRAALSVLAQTEGDLELIVVDDGSTDDTLSALAEIRDPRLRVVRQEHGGACRARNKGAALSRGQYVAFQDSDDVWRRDKLAVQLRCFRETGADVVFCQLMERRPDGSVSLFPSRSGQGFLGPDDSLLGAGTQTLLGLREAFLAFPFDPDMPRLQEFEMLCRLRKRYAVYYLDRPLVDYRPGGDSISADPEKLIRAIRLLWEKHPALFSDSSEVKAALAGRLRLDARNACLAGNKGYKDCLRFAAELDDPQANMEERLMKAGLYAPYIKLREALKKQRDGKTFLWRALASPVRAARKLREAILALRQAEQIRCFDREKSVFGIRLARRWAFAAAADILTGGHTHFYHRAIRQFLDGELADVAQTARALPVPRREEGPFPVWTLWWDGEESAPLCVKLALHSQKKYFSGPEYAYHVLTKENYAEYAEIDPAVQARFEKGGVTLTHFSDILRCELLCRWGGLWMDATVYMTGPLNWESVTGSFYSIHKTTYPDNLRRMIPAGRWSGYVMHCRPGDPLAAFLTAALRTYWRKYPAMPDYYLIDELIDAAYRLIPQVRRMIDGVPLNNERVFDLYNMRNDAYLPGKVEPILRANCLHKLSWKDQYLDCRPDGRMTVWKWMREEARREV